MSKRVIVASLNPVKINSTIQGFHTLFPQLQWQVKGLEATSGVSDQPMSDEETLQGAINRAESAKNLQPEADFWVGIEGGCEKKFQQTWVFAWVVILTEQNCEMARTSSFTLPPEIALLVDQGMELGDATDVVFHKRNSKHDKGVVGMLSHGHIDRTEYYVQPMILALMHLYKRTSNG